MARAATIRSQIQFGPFTVDLRTGELLKYGTRIKLQARPFCMLAMLLEHPGEVVTRDEMRARLWPDGTFVDFDNNISSAIGKLRAALGDSAAAPRYIETAGRGYRLAVIVRPVEPENLAIETAKPSVEYEGAGTIRFPESLRGIWILVTAIVCLVSGAVFTYSSHRSRPQHSSQSAPARMMLAVLPFQNLTGDAGQEYFSDGFTEEVITQLGRVDPQHLGVIARTSILGYRPKDASVAQIARELGVQYLLEGSVRRNSETVRITAQLIRTSDSTHLMAKEYDREVKDLLQVQAEIAQEISDEIQIAIGSHPGHNATPVVPIASYQSYDLYLRGRYYWNKRTPAGFHEAIRLFEQAVGKDPEYARAYAGLADSYAMLSIYGFDPTNKYLAKARSAALTALQLDDSLAEAHTSLAMVAQSSDYDWQTAEKEFRCAIDLDPNYATAHQWYAESLAFQGRFEEALAESERARQLDPLSLVVAADNGAILYFSRQYDRAIERFRSVLAMDPSVARAHLVIAAYVQKGQFHEALADLDVWRRASGDAPWIWAWRAYVYEHAGKRTEAEQSRENLQHLDRRWQIDPAQFLSVAYASAEYKDTWLACLESSYRAHKSLLSNLQVDPIYDPLRGEPRFQDLLRRVRSGQNGASSIVSHAITAETASRNSGTATPDGIVKMR